MTVRISERNRRGERMWMVAVYVFRCAAPTVCLSPILLLGNTKSSSAFCMLAVLSMWLLRLLPLPVSTCLMSLFLLSMMGGAVHQDETTVHGFGVDSVVLIASLSLFVVADSTSLSLRTALWLLSMSGARLRPLVFAFMTASFLGALVLPDFLVALVLSSVLENTVLHLRSKFVSKHFRTTSQSRTPLRQSSFSPVEYERMLQEMDAILKRKIQPAPPADRSSSRIAAASRGQTERAALRKMESLMADVCGRVALGVALLPTDLDMPFSQSPSDSPLQSIDEPLHTSSTPALEEPQRHSQHSLLVAPRKLSLRQKSRRTSCPAFVLRDAATERRSDAHARLSECGSTIGRKRLELEPWDRSQYSLRASSRLSAVGVRRGTFTGRPSSTGFPGETDLEDHESGSADADFSGLYRSKARRLSSLQQINFGDTTEAPSSRQLMPWNCSREDLTRTSSHIFEDPEAIRVEKMCLTIRKTFIIGVVMTSTLASACAKSTRALIAAGIPRYSFKASALIVLPTALCATVLCWTALFFTYLSEYDGLPSRSSAFAIHDVMLAKLSSLGKVELQESVCISVCIVTAVTCSALLITKQVTSEYLFKAKAFNGMLAGTIVSVYERARWESNQWDSLIPIQTGSRQRSRTELVTSMTLVALAFMFGFPSVSSLHLRNVIAQLPWNIILIHGGSIWLSTALKDSGLAVWFFSGYTEQRFRDTTHVWQLLVILSVTSLVNESGQEPSALSEQVVPIVSYMGLELKGDPLFFAVPVAAACFLPVVTPICHLGLAFVYEHTAASFGETALLGLLLKVVTTVALTLFSTTFFAFHTTSKNDTDATFIHL